MEKKKDISNITLFVLSIILIIVLCLYVNAIKQNNKTVSESEYRNELKANLTYEYITKPSEEENAQMEEEEQKQNEETQNRQNQQLQEELNNMVEEFNVIPGVEE